jgi:hypothetical protein
MSKEKKEKDRRKKNNEDEERRKNKKKGSGLVSWFPFLFLPISRSLTFSLSLPVFSEKKVRERTGKKEKGEERREGRTTGFLSPFYSYSDRRKKNRIT